MELGLEGLIHDDDNDVINSSVSNARLKDVRWEQIH